MTDTRKLLGINGFVENEIMWNRKTGSYICFSMETIEKSIFYIGIAFGECAESSKKLRKSGLPIFKAESKMSFPEGNVQLYFSLFPEYAGQTLFGKKFKEWKSELVREILTDVCALASNKFFCREILLAPGLYRYVMPEETEEKQQDDMAEMSRAIPLELLKASLYRHRPFHKICVSLPEEGGTYLVEQLEELLYPYLSKVQQVVYAGKPSELTEILEEYLYEEFGMIMTIATKPPRNMLWIDLRDETERRACPWQDILDNKCVNRAETLKFLDTMAKNGYNTKVN